MTREEILKSPEYWVTQIQIAICRCADTFMRKHNMNRTQLAEYLGVSKGYVTQILAGDYNYSIEKLADISVKLGYVPNIEFVSLPKTIQEDLVCSQTSISSISMYNSSFSSEIIHAA